MKEEKVRGRSRKKKAFAVKPRIMAELRRFWAMAVCISIVCSNIFTLTSKAAVSALTEEKVVELALTAETLRKKAVKAIKQGKYVDATDFEFEGDLDRVEAYEALFCSENPLYEVTSVKTDELTLEVFARTDSGTIEDAEIIFLVTNDTDSSLKGIITLDGSTIIATGVIPWWKELEVGPGAATPSQATVKKDYSAATPSQATVKEDYSAATPSQATGENGESETAPPQEASPADAESEDENNAQPVAKATISRHTRQLVMSPAVSAVSPLSDSGYEPVILERSGKKAAAAAFVRSAAELGITGEQESVLPDPVEWERSKSKTAANLDENYESDVTLSLPAAEYKGMLDVAFVLDGSTSTDEDELAAAAAGLLDELASMENLNVKVSLTVFGGSVPILGKTDLLDISNAENLKQLKNMLVDQSYDKMDGRSGSNLQAGVDTARAILNGDEEVDAADKYLVCLTDGGARMWWDGTEALSQTYDTENGSNTKSIFWGSNSDAFKRWMSNKISPRRFADIWAADQEDVNAYGMTKAQLDAVAEDAVNAVKVEKTKTFEEFGIASWQTAATATGLGANYYTTYEAAVYNAARSIAAGASEANIILVSYPYHKNSADWGNTVYDFANDFKCWLADNGYVTQYVHESDTSKEERAKEIFGNIKNDLIQVVDAGSKVKDVIGKTSDYDFDFINDASRLKLTVGEEAYEVTAISEGLVEGENACYGFGKADGSKDGTTYPFVLHYYDETSEAADEYFVWDINVPVTKEQTVQLTYGVKLTNPKTAPGTYGEYDADGSENDGNCCSAN